MKKPLLSICIPTYNRAEYLKQCLESIIYQKEFDDRVEIVISDNCSNDNTQEIGEKYQSQYRNIHYYRNDRNVVDMNYPLVFQRANGLLRKLTNDTIIYKKNALKYMLEAIEDNMEERPQLYFKNKGACSPTYFASLEEYVGSIGYLLTWIGSVALWEEDCDDMQIMYNNADSRLGQVPMLLENFEKHGGAVVYDSIIMGGISPKPKNLSYGLYKVFYQNFLGFISKYVEKNIISERCYEKVRQGLLIDFFSQWIVNYKLNNGEFIFSDEKLQELVEKEYREEKYYYQYKVKLNYRLIRAYISRAVHRK